MKHKERRFPFESFKVPKFSYDEGNHNGSNIKLGLSPSGIYNSATGEFELTLVFMTHDASNLDKVIFQLTSIAIFRFDSTLNWRRFHLL